MDEQQSFLISTDTTINPSVISSTNNNDSNSPQSPVNNESHTSFIDKEKSFEHELSGIPENEHLNRHIQDMMIDHVDTDDITEDTDDDEDDQGDINQQSGKMDPFNFHYSNNANDSDDSMKQVSDGNKDTGKLIYSKSASNNSPEDKRPRKFICRYCNKAFSLMNVLKVHERIHTGEKPYVCEICNKAFNQSGSLNRHKNTHTKRSSDNRSYSCRFCPRQFLHSSQLQDHETVEHSMEITLSKSKSNDMGAGSYITPPISSMADESNIIKQNHLSSQLLHNKVISDSLKLSGTEFNKCEQSKPIDTLKILSNALRFSITQKTLEWIFYFDN
ncbi:unnamed protein product [Heterobilharzia americana]|nr:unnamed protein product [Heterobilharzia americana]